MTRGREGRWAGRQAGMQVGGRYEGEQERSAADMIVLSMHASTYSINRIFHYATKL